MPKLTVESMELKVEQDATVLQVSAREGIARFCTPSDAAWPFEGPGKHIVPGPVLERRIAGRRGRALLKVAA